ncbi:flagellar motor switch protein FliM [Azospirillum thiophilum]|uniref:Flagellar motor switch protein FliM n=1 Tax=Azospirillum thiophilum TaxID=528244 RepID=A0AAC8W4F5_9PROT|nr:flagellar motor switch protein FliM [Azospirillum thiophilum]ALG74925.1 flagellar motor switch protein FliM [Azospirillum thiophilum]KJR62312.1 flagellar motor switch protein FliM [Azospirillum thiophilum]
MTNTPVPPSDVTAAATAAATAVADAAPDAGADWSDAAWELAAAQPAAQPAPANEAANEAAADAMAGFAGDTKTLSQEEIDRLLNFAAPEGGGAEMSAIQRLVSSTTVNKDRLPMLDVVFDRMVRLLNTSLRQFASTNVEASLSKIEWLRYTDFQDAIELPALIGVARAEPWDNQMLVTIDSALIYCMMDVLLGGRRSRPGRIDGRAYTSIERKMTERMMKVVLQDLGQSFDPLAQVDFVFDRLEVNPQFATITRATNAIIRVRIAVEVERRTGHIDIVIPYATLEPVRGKLVQMFMGEKFGHDTVWENHLKNELMRSKLELVAVLAETKVPLGEVLAWQKGQSLKLRINPDSTILVFSKTIPLFAGHMGQRNDNIAVKIDTDLDTKQELIDGLLSH